MYLFTRKYKRKLFSDNIYILEKMFRQTIHTSKHMPSQSMAFA